MLEETIFFYVGPPQENIFSDHLLQCIFQSTMHIYFTDYISYIDRVELISTSCRFHPSFYQRLPLLNECQRISEPSHHGWIGRNKLHIDILNIYTNQIKKFPTQAGLEPWTSQFRQAIQTDALDYSTTWSPPKINYNCYN